MSKNQKGFSAVEGLLILIIIAAVVGIGTWVYKQRNAYPPSDQLSSQSSRGSASGTTGSIDQLTQDEAQKETTINQQADGDEQSTTSNINQAQRELGGAYNESAF